MTASGYGLQIDAQFWRGSSAIAIFEQREHGPLLQFLLLAWDHLKATGQGLADDERSLAQLAGVTLRTWRKRLGPKIRTLFQPAADGLLYCDELMKDYAKMTERINERAAAGRVGAAARWNTPRKPAGKQQSNGMVQAKAVVNGTPDLYAAATGQIGVGTGIPVYAIASESHTENGSKAMRNGWQNDASSSSSVSKSLEALASGSNSAGVVNEQPPGIALERNEPQPRRAASTLHPLEKQTATGPAIERRAASDGECADADGAAIAAVAEVEPMTAEEIRQLAKMLHTAARQSPAGRSEPDGNITAEILRVCGSVAAYLELLAEIDRRGISQANSYGYFLTLARERTREPL